MRRNRNITSAVILMLGILNYCAFGQNTDNKNSADRALQSSGRVNVSTLGMEIDIPLGSYPGRGINVPISLSYSSKQWRMESMGNQPIAGGNYSSCYANYSAVFAEETASGWTASLAVPYIEYTGMNNPYQSNGSPVSYDDVDCPTTEPPPGSYPYYLIRRLVAHLPSGETHELRIDDTAWGYTVGTTPPNSFWDGTYYAADGSNIKYIRNSTTNTYRLLMPDGSFYDFNTAIGVAKRMATKFTDRNGNFTTYYAPGSTDNQGVTHPNGYWKDTLGRNLSIPIGLDEPTVPTTAQSPQVYSMPGMTGTYKLQWKQLKGATADESGLTDFLLSLKPVGDAYLCYTSQGYPTTCVHPAGVALFSGGGNAAGPRVMGSTVFSPIVLKEIELPTGQKYKFSYDIYGRIEEITYPTGGKEVFQYSVVPTLSMLEYDDLTAQANFGVTDRKVYPTSGQTANYNWTYEAGYVAPQGYQVNINNPDGTRSERLLRRGNDAGTFSGFGYDNALAGMAFEESGYNSANGLVSKKLTAWTATQLQTSGGSMTQTAHWHPRVTQEESLLYENGNGISATSKYFYASDLNLRETPLLQNKEEQYAFVVAGGPLPSTPIRTSETTFSTNGAYLDQNMAGLATSSQVKDSAGTVVSRSEMVYDESGRSPGYRGNPTTAKVWDSTKGVITNPAAYISTSARFDTYGNQYEATDAKGNTTTTTFDSTHHAFPIQVTSPVPDPSGQNGSNAPFVTSTTFDFTTGLPTSTTDINGQTTTIEYNDALLRPTKITAPNGHQTITEYGAGTTASTRFVKVRSQIDETKWKEAYTWFDGLGRTIKSQSVDTAGDVFSETLFDSVGRPWKTSNPYRMGDTIYWTESTFDAAGRPWKITTPDNAIVETTYDLATSGSHIGTVVTVKDQAFKERRSVTNALGQLIRVDEPNDAGQLGTIASPNQPTNYSYDTLNNLTAVNQGVQTRTFSYNNLSRLTSAANPESGTINYVYDNNGNLTSKTDARGVKTDYMYDALNRVTNRNYSTPDCVPPGCTIPNYQASPNVTYTYDNLPNAKGKLIKVTTGTGATPLSVTEYQEFDLLGRVKQSQQWVEGTAYGVPMTYTYNLSGALIEQKYPSGRIVRNTLDSTGDLQQVQSQKSGGTLQNYANAFTYTAAGAVSALRLGNGKWETTQFNSRLQPTQIGLGSGSAVQNLLKLNYTYNTNGNTDNNGNVLSQTITVPTVGANQGFTATQTYTYDSLNRIKDVVELIGTGETWRQTFLYDRYGNRTFDTTANRTTTIPAGCSAAVCNPSADPATNKLVGYQFDNSGNTKVDANGQVFTYDSENKQVQVDNDAGVVGQYSYNGDGQRIKKIVPSTGETTIFVYDASNRLVAEYSTIVEPTSTAKTSYLTNDHLGSPRITTDAVGQVISRRDFRPFGEEITRANYGNDSVRQKFTGYERDSESGLDYAQERMLCSAIGRFGTPDPYNIIFEKEKGRDNDEKSAIFIGFISNPQRWNMYIYVLNNPLVFTDPDGREPNTVNVFIGYNASEEDLKKWEKIKNDAAKNGITVVIYSLKDKTATGANFIKSLKAENTVTVFVGHSYSRDNEKVGLDFHNGGLGNQEAVRQGKAKYTADGVDIKNDALAVFSCGFGNAFANISSSNKTVFVSISNGDDHKTEANSVIKAANRFVETVSSSFIAFGGLSNAAHNAGLAVTGSSDSHNVGDKVVYRVLPPPKRRK